MQLLRTSLTLILITSSIIAQEPPIVVQGANGKVEVTYRQENERENAEKKNINTTLLFRGINGTEFAFVRDALTTSCPADVNAPLQSYNNVTPLDFAIDRAIGQAKKYKHTGAATAMLYIGLTGLLVGGLTLAESAFSRDLTSLGLGCAACIGGILNLNNSSIYWNDLKNSLSIVKFLLTNCNLDLTKTKLNLDDQATKDAITWFRNFDWSVKSMQQFVDDVADSEYHNLQIKQ